MEPERTEEEKQQFSRFRRLWNIHISAAALITLIGISMSALENRKVQMIGFGIQILGAIAFTYYYKMWRKGYNQFHRINK